MADQTNIRSKFIQSRGTKCVSPEKYQKLWQIPTGFRHAAHDNAGLYFRMAQDRLIRNIYSFITHKQLHILFDVTYKTYSVLVSLNNIRNNLVNKFN